jgi:hypothetical protein
MDSSSSMSRIRRRIIGENDIRGAEAPRELAAGWT